MLAYRHGFHAGNHADVFKHVVLVALLRYLCGKEKPFWYVDTHAGAGRYSLLSPMAEKLGEYRDGIARLWARDDVPSAVADYLDLVRAENPDGQLRTYPGSPFLAAATTRAHDRLRLYERHRQDLARLRESLVDAGERVLVADEDGFLGLRALLPPPPRRALVLIDPSYEEKRDYQRVVVALRDAVTRFPGGVYMVWYPQLVRLEAHELPRRLQQVPVAKWLNVSLQVTTPSASGIGLFGSGAFIINPPWTLEATLQAAMPFLTQVLAQDDSARFSLTSKATTQNAAD